MALVVLRAAQLVSAEAARGSQPVKQEARAVPGPCRTQGAPAPKLHDAILPGRGPAGQCGCALAAGLQLAGPPLRPSLAFSPLSAWDVLTLLCSLVALQKRLSCSSTCLAEEERWCSLLHTSLYSVSIISSCSYQPWVPPLCEEGQMDALGWQGRASAWTPARSALSALRGNQGPPSPRMTPQTLLGTVCLPCQLQPIPSCL